MREVGGRRAGQRKDTSRNIVAHGEFVVNIGDETMVEAVHRSADEYPPEVSETQLLGLELAPSELIATPRLAAVPVAMECRLHSVQEFGETRAEFIVGEVLVFHFRDGICKGGKVEDSLNSSEVIFHFFRTDITSNHSYFSFDPV